MNQRDRIFLESVVARALYAMTDDVSLFLESKSSLPMLFEALGEDDMVELSKQVADAKKDLEDLYNLLGDDVSIMTNTEKMLKTIAQNLPSATGLAALNLFGSKKNIAKKVSQAAIAIDSINSARTSILNAAVLLATELGSLEFVRNTMKLANNDFKKKDFDTAPLKSFMDDYATKIDMPPYKAIKAGITRSYKAPKGPPGWMGTAADMFGGLLGLKKFPKLSAKQFKSDMLRLSFGKIMALGKKAKKAAAAASAEATQDTQYVAGLGQGLQQTTTTDTTDTTQDAAAEDTQATGEAQGNVLQFPNIEKLAALGKERFGDNGDTLITNFFTDDRVKKAFGVSESFTLESLLFEAEEEEGEEEEVDEVEFEELLPIAQEVGNDLEPDVTVDEDELGDFFDTAEEQDLLPASVKKIRKLKFDTVYEYTVATGKNKGKVRKVNVVGPSGKEGYYQVQLQKKNGEFSKDEYSLPLRGFGDQVNESHFVNRWNVLAGMV